MTYIQSFILWFQELSTKKKISLISCSALLILLTGLSIWWVLAPSYGVLFTQLDEKDANQIVNQLESDTISYQLRHNGHDILIDKNLIAKTRLKIMASGLNLSGQIGFELFDKNDLGMSDFSQKINYQRALQGELERTIASLEEISQARVHLVIPEHHLFEQETNKPKAAITLHLKSALAAKQVASIQQLVSASVPHLNLKNVVVVDQNGNTLSSHNETKNLNHLTNKKTMETYLSNKVMHLLEKVFKEKNILVKVDVLLNYDEIQRERINPKSQGLVTHEKKIKHGIQDKGAKDKSKHDFTVEKSYQLGSEKESFKRANGTIERLSISVILPKNTSPETLKQIQNIVKNTVGFNAQRGDQISVEALIEPIARDHKKTLPIPVLNTTDIARVPPLYYLAFLLLLCSTSLLFLSKQRKKKRLVLLLELTQWLEHHD